MAEAEPTGKQGVQGVAAPTLQAGRQAGSGTTEQPRCVFLCRISSVSSPGGGSSRGGEGGCAALGRIMVVLLLLLLHQEAPQGSRLLPLPPLQLGDTNSTSARRACKTAGHEGCVRACQAAKCSLQGAGPGAATQLRYQGMLPRAPGRPSPNARLPEAPPEEHGWAAPCDDTRQSSRKLNSRARAHTATSGLHAPGRAEAGRAAGAGVRQGSGGGAGLAMGAQLWYRV